MIPAISHRVAVQRISPTNFSKGPIEGAPGQGFCEEWHLPSVILISKEAALYLCVFWNESKRRNTLVFHDIGGKDGGIWTKNIQ
jgi:hypothetical protein